MIPESFGRFVVEAEIAKQEFGGIFKATDPKYKRPVALHTLDLGLTTPDAVEAVRSLQQQARAASTLNSPNIASIYGGGEDHGHFFVAVEFVEGFTIQSVLDRKNNEVSVGELTDITRQVCLALDHAFSKGFVHPNLRPVNIMSEWDGMVKILDYGFPKPSLTRLFSSPHIPNRLHYVSPEEVRGEKADLRSNLFSWASILYELVTGSKAFPGDSIEDVKKKLLECAPVRAESLAKNGRASMCGVIAKALSKSPEDRYQTGGDLIRDLETRNAPAVVVPQQIPSATKSEIMLAPPKPVSAEAVSPPVWTPPVAKPAPAPAMSQTVYAGDTHPGGSPDLQQSAKAAVAGSSRASEKASSLLEHPLAKQFEVLIQKIPMKYGLYTIGAVLCLVVIGTIAMLGYHKGKAYEPPPQMVVAEVAPMPMSPPTAQVQQTTRIDVAAKEADFSQTEIIHRIPAPAKTPAGKKAKMVAIAALPAMPTTGGLLLNSSPEGAQVAIDGHTDAAWVTPFSTTSLPAGSHTVNFTKSGYTAHMQSVIVPAGSTASVSVTLGTMMAVFAVSSEPAGASVLLDGRDTGKVTPASLPVEKGKHSVSVRHAGYFDAETSAELTPGQTMQFAPTLKVMGDVDSLKTASKFKKVFGGPAKDMGAVVVKSMPKGSRIELNHRMLDKTAPAEFMLAPGNYLVTVSMPGYKSVEKMVSVEAGGRVVVDDNLGN